MTTTPVEQRRLNGAQTSGRSYRNLSEPVFGIQRTDTVTIPTRDGTLLHADVFLPSTGHQRRTTGLNGAVVTDSGTQVAPALISYSCYPRQIQDLGAPMGFIEAGASDFFAARGYAHVIVNARGTGGSEGTFGFLDEQERQDIYDAVEWIAGQPWCDGHVGGMGISYFAIAQLAAAVQRPPHLKAIFPFGTLDDPYEAVWPRGVLNSGFFSAWMPAIGIMAGVPDHIWHGRALDVARRVLNAPAVHGRMEHVNGAVAGTMLRAMNHVHYADEPFGRLWQQAAVEHPTHDSWWDERNLRGLLSQIDIPVYLGCQWDNVPMHLPSTFPVWEGLRHNPNVRLSLLAEGGLLWPWETMHVEALAWYDHWLKGRDTGIMDGPPIRYVIPGTDRWQTAENWPPAETGHVRYALRADGMLASEPDGEATPGSRSYLHTPADSGRPANANPAPLPDRLIWQTEPVGEALDILGEIELHLDATITALDTTWIAVLSDVAADGTAVPLSAGWLRAQLRTADENASRPGRPVIPCREPVPVPVGQTVRYRIPIVPNARRIAGGHRLRLVIASADEGENELTMLGFTHTAAGEASVNTVHSSSQLLIPILPGRHRV